jgi:hypothetical protein
MFNKESLSKIKDYLILIGASVFISCMSYFTVTLTYSEILASNSIFEAICQFPLVFLALIFLCLEALILYALAFLIYNTIKDLFRKYKTATILIALLIWFTSAQGIFNRIILGPRDNQAMAELLYKKARETKEYRIGAICSDGWESSATGRGACSWHGGVEEWLYETETYYSRSLEECKDEAEQMSLLDYYVFWW